MEDRNVELLQQLIQNNRDDINRRLDDHGKLIHDIGTTVKRIADEYDQVLVEQRAAKAAAEHAAELAKIAVEKAESSSRKLRNYIAIFASISTIVLTALPFVLRLLHIG